MRLIAISILLFVLPFRVPADVSGTQTLAANTALNLDTGATASSGGDLLWDGSSLVPQGKATAFGIAANGAALFDGEVESVLKGFKILASAAPIPSSKLPVNELLAVYTNGGNVAKLLVTANSGGSITLKFVTFEAPPPPSGPHVGAVANNSSNIAPGFPNYGIAPSSLFIVYGTGLTDPGDLVFQSSQPPGLPTTLNGTSLTVVVNGVTTHPALYYAVPTQLAAVLPANTPVGPGTLTVTYRGAVSPPAAIQVVPSAVGINVYNTNSGVATDNSTGALLTYTNSGTPGEFVVLWATGLGSDPASSDTTFTTAPHNVGAQPQIYIGGVAATVLYWGPSGYPGVNQINVTIPDSVPNGCWVPVAAVAGGVVSNIVTLPINNGGGACSDALTGLNANQFSAAGGGTLRTGLVALIQTHSAKGDTTNSTDAAFEKYSGLYSPQNSVSPGGCIVNDLTPVQVNFTGLDPGTISLTGPAGLSVTLGPQLGIKGAFFAALAAGAIPQSGGTFTFKGSGGADVSSFTSTITFTNPLLSWTNPSVAESIDRTQGLPVTWTGGNPGSYVFITGSSISTSNSNIIGGFTCLVSADAGQFTVPSYILSALPAGKGGVGVQNDVYSSLSAGGLDIGLALGDISYSASGTYK